MTSAIDALPNTYDFGLAFNYALWDEQTVLTLTNVAWNNDYRDIVRFANRTALDAYIDAQPNTTIRNLSLVKFNQNVKINLPINAAMRFNYLRASNPAAPVEGDVQRNYYYFVTGVNYLAPQTTELVLQLDVWQTFGYDVAFGSCYVERGHIGIANTNNFAHYGRDYLTESEGLDIGGEYRTIHVTSRDIMTADTSGGYDVLICSTVDLSKNPTDFGTSASPKLITAKGSIFQGYVSGAAFYILSVDSFRLYLQEIQNYPWITQGIISVTIIPKLSRYYPTFTYTNVAPSDISANLYSPPTDAPQPKDTVLQGNWRSASFVGNILGSRYAALKKFFTYPYMVLELTTWSGSPVIIKPEMWQDPDATVREIASLVPPSQRIAIMPLKYNADAETDLTTVADPAPGLFNDDHGEFLDVAVILASFPQVPIVNNMAAAFLAENKNGLAFSYRSADWSQQKALQGNQVGYDQASAGMNLMSQLTNTGTGAASASAALQSDIAMRRGAISAITGVGSGAAGGSSGGPAGMAVGAAGGAIGGIGALGQASLTQQSITGGTAISNAAAQQSNSQRQGTAGYMRDTNKNLADFSAKGDYANAIAGIQAKVQDSQMTQPSTSGQFGGDGFNFVNNHFGFSLRWKMPNLNALRSVGDYWLRYGYAVRQFVDIPATMQVMTKFTYWKLSETYISQAPIPEGFKQIIRGIFEKGVTVWADPDDIGVTDWADNHPLTGAGAVSF